MLNLRLYDPLKGDWFFNLSYLPQGQTVKARVLPDPHLLATLTVFKRIGTKTQLNVILIWCLLNDNHIQMWEQNTFASKWLSNTTITQHLTDDNWAYSQ